MSKTIGERALFTKPLNSQQFKELIECKKNPFYFSKFIKVVHPIRGQVSFELFDFQKAVLWEFMNNRFNIVLKFRQAGITELISLFCLWLALYHSNKNIVIISIKDRVAKKVLRRIKYMYRYLPDHLKIPIINGRVGDYGTVQEMHFSNNSMISSIPTTEEAGRSDAVSLFVIDEAAIVKWINNIWASILPTISTGGSAIVNSTPFGTGNWFHKTWVDAVTGVNEFNPIRLDWRMHPERDDEWYRVMSLSLGPRRTAQEIDCDFLTSGYSVFDLEDIKDIEESLVDYPPIETRLNGQLKIFKRYNKRRFFTIGIDVSTGRAQDYSAFTLMDDLGEEYAVFKGKISVDRLADLVMDLGEEYGWATLAPESNDIGLAVTSKIQNSGYPNLYYSEKILRKKGSNRPETEAIPGWLTTSKNRSVIIDELEEDIRKDSIIVKDPYFVQEAYTFIYDSSNRAVALGKHKRSRGSEDDIEDELIYSDDSIMAKAITNRVRKRRINFGIVAPQ